MSNQNQRKANAEEHLEQVRDEAEEEAPEADEERPEDKARHLTPGVGWTRGKDIEDVGDQKDAPKVAHTELDRSGEKKYEREAKNFVRKDRQ